MGEQKMIDRCNKCGLWNVENVADCPQCGEIMDLCIAGLCLSWKCRKCDYGVATTVNKLCCTDNNKFPKDCYSKIKVCPYGKE